MSSQQYILPFEAAKGELLTQVAMLRFVETDLKPVWQDRVVDLLERLILLGNDLTEKDGVVYIRAANSAVAARVDRRHTVKERTVQNWAVWAEQLGVLQRDVRSQRYGRREWNEFRINVNRIRELCRRRQDGKAEAGSGRKWPEMNSSPRGEMNSSPRGEMNSSPRGEMNSSPSYCREIKHSLTSHAVDTQPRRDTHAKPDTQAGEVMRVFLNLGVRAATTLVSQALDRGSSPRDLLAIARWFERSQRSNPNRWQKPESVLALRLKVATPGLPAHCGWIPGNLPPKPKPPKKSADSEMEFRSGYRRHLISQGVTGDRLVDAVEHAVVQWKIKQSSTSKGTPSL